MSKPVFNRSPQKKGLTNIRKLIYTIIAIVFVISFFIPGANTGSTFADFERITENTGRIAMSLQHWGAALQQYAGRLADFADREIDEPAMPSQTTVVLAAPSAPGACTETSCHCSGDGSSREGIGMANPAAVYCQEMGYEYKVLKTKDGEQGVCVFPDGSQCDEWAFYRGEAGQEFSYCARNGWRVAPEGKGDAFSTRCTTCLLPDGSQKTVNELLKLDAKCAVKMDVPDEQPAPVPTQVGQASPPLKNASLPAHFDWRDNGGDWMTSVKNQGGCGSCWAFSAVGAVEPQYNIANSNPDLDLDLSEQYLVSDCGGTGGDCTGGWHATALAYIMDQGITDEACFPYTETYASCSGRCSDWSDRLKKIDDTTSVPNNVETIRQYLIDYGGYFDNNIYRCTTDTGMNHCVVITGYDATENYWIVKNSWGSTWHDAGYFKVGCQECSIENYVYYAKKNSPPNIRVDPSVFNVTMPPDTVQDYTLKINNDGESTLSYRISDREYSATSEAGSSPAETSIPADLSGLSGTDRAESQPVNGSPQTSTNYVRDVSPLVAVAACDWSNCHETDALHDTLTDFGYSYIDVTTVAEAEAAGADVLIGYYGCSSLNPSDVNYYISTGNGFIQIGDQIGDWVPWFANDYEPIGEGNTVTVTINDATHPIAAGLPGSWKSHGFCSYGDDNEDFVGWVKDDSKPNIGSLQATDHDLHDRGISVATLGAGRAVFLGFNVYGDLASEDDKLLFHNALDWVNADCPWLDVNPKTGGVEFGNHDEVTVTVDTTGIGVGSSDTGNIVVHNNDPTRNPTIVPVNLTVVEEPEWFEIISDPAGDQYHGSGPDLVGVDAARITSKAKVYFRVRANAPIDSYNTCSTLLLDTDQNPVTGFVSTQPDFPTNDIGADYRVDVISEPGAAGEPGKWPAVKTGTITKGSQFSAELYVWNTPGWAPIAPIPFHYYGNNLCFSIPFSLLNDDDGYIDVVEIISDAMMPTDVGPNQGHGTTCWKIVGSDIPGSSNTAANRLILGKFQAAQTGNITQMSVYSRASGHVKVAIYEDNAGKPGNLLGANNTPTPVTAGRWNTISLPPTGVIQSTYYWLAAANDTAGAISHKGTAGSGSSRSKAITFSTFSFIPNPTGLTSYTYRRAFAGWGEVSAPTIQQLIGTDKPGSANTAANKLILAKFQAAQTGNITQMHVYSRASGNVKAAVYADNAGKPGGLLNANNTPTHVTAGQWNTISLPSTAVISGRYYWLAAANDTAGAISHTSTVGSGTSRSKAITFSTFSFTSNPTGLTSNTYRRAFAGWGIGGP
jgi:putative hemolysin